MVNFVNLIILVIAVFLGIFFVFYPKDEELKWEWDKIDTSLETQIKLFKKVPHIKDFLWGTATAAHQVEGDNNNQWTYYESTGKIPKGIQFL